jgi:hypothetical protein
MAPKGKKQESVKTTLRLPRTLWDEIRIKAIKDGVTAQDMVINALSAFLKGGKA